MLFDLVLASTLVAQVSAPNFQVEYARIERSVLELNMKVMAEPGYYIPVCSKNTITKTWIQSIYLNNRFGWWTCRFTDGTYGISNDLDGQPIKVTPSITLQEQSKKIQQFLSNRR